jgi:Cu/Ag efflux pump CusA
MNMMVLAGLMIALGALIHDAILSVENTVRRLRRHRQEGSVNSTSRIILDSWLEVAEPIVYATVIIAVTVAPIFLMEGVIGTFFRPLAFSYALAVLASMVVALTVTPALSLLLLADAPVPRRQHLIVTLLERCCDGALGPIMRRPRLALVSLVGIAVAGLGVLPFFGQSLVPDFHEQDLLIHLTGAPGTSQPEMSRIAARISHELRAIPGIRNVGAHIGRAVLGDQVVGINSAELWLSIDPASDHDRTVAAVREVVDGYPGVRREVHGYVRERGSEAVAATGDPLVVRLYGEESRILRSKAAEVRLALSSIEGIADARVKLPVEEPALEVEVDLAAAQRYGIKPGDVRRAAATILSGIQVGSLFEEQKVFDVVVWSTPKTRHSLDDIRSLLVDTPDGGHVRLADVAQVRIVPTANTIQRAEVSRYVDISANIRGRDRASVAADVQKRLAQFTFPMEYHAHILGDFAEQQAAWNRSIVLGVAALIGIFFILQAAFASWRLAAASFLTLPSAIAGSVLAAGGIFSLGAITGFLTVLGIAARNGISLIKHYHHLERHEDEPFGPELIRRATRERIMPIVATTLTTAVAFLPFALRGDIAGLEVVHPMAVVILSGLVTSTLLSLFGVPALYLLFGATREPDLELTPEVSQAETLEALAGVGKAVAGVHKQPVSFELS